MKKVTYVCNICDEEEGNLDCELSGFVFDIGNELKRKDKESAGIHICDECADAFYTLVKKSDHGE